MRVVCHAALFLGAIGFAVVSMPMQGQGMSPMSQEFSKRARGTVEVTNNSDAERLVSCRAQGFDVDEHGAIHLHALSGALNVRMNTERVMLAPKDSRQISFDADPYSLPAWFAVTCRFTPVQRRRGLTLAMEISSVVIVDGSHLNTDDVTLSAKHVGSSVQVEVINKGPGLARVSSGEVVGHKKQAALKTFILFPHQTRLVETAWKETAAPEIARIHIGRKRLEALVN